MIDNRQLAVDKMRASPGRASFVKGFETSKFLANTEGEAAGFFSKGGTDHLPDDSYRLFSNKHVRDLANEQLVLHLYF